MIPEPVETSHEIVVHAQRLPEPAAAPLDEEGKLLALWLHGLSRHTARAYRSDWKQFRAFAPGPLRAIRLEQLQGFVDHLNNLSLRPGSRHRTLSGVKSFFAFAHRLGFLPFDVSQPLRLPAGKDALNERILDVEEVGRLVNASKNPRNRAILELLYFAGLRVSELVALKWKDARARKEGGQVTVFGKGNKTRTVLVPASTWAAMLEQSCLGAESFPLPDYPIFVSGGQRIENRIGSIRHLSTSQVLRIVKANAKASGINKPVSPHWLRHCHCSHALDGGAPIHLVQATAGHSSVATTSRYLHARPNESSSSFLPKIDRSR